MLVERYAPEDVFARMPELAGRTDPVLTQIDRLLEDDLLLQQVKADLLQRYPQTGGHGRQSTPVEVILRLLVIKHLHHWSFAETEQWVGDSLALRWFTCVYFHPVPDDTTFIRWANSVQPATLQALHHRVTSLAQHLKVTQGRKLRLEGTVMQTTIHHPTNSRLLLDGGRVLSRLVRRAKPVVQDQLHGVPDAFRTWVRTMRRGLQAIAWTARQKGDEAAECRADLSRKIIITAEQTVRQAHCMGQAREEGSVRMQRTSRRLREDLAHFLPRVEQVLRQTRGRVLEGQKVPATEKLVSLFEPHTQIIQRHTQGTAVEFGRKVMTDEVKGGLVTRYAVLEGNGAEQDQLHTALHHHQQVFGHAPTLVIGERGTHCPQNERLAREVGVPHLVIPWSGPLPPARRAREKERGGVPPLSLAGRSSSLQRDYGLERCVSHGLAGLERGARWCILASNLQHIGQALAAWPCLT